MNPTGIGIDLVDVEELAVFGLEGGFRVMLTLVLNVANCAWNV